MCATVQYAKSLLLTGSSQYRHVRLISLHLVLQ
jgi:hypothetical protein